MDTKITYSKNGMDFNQYGEIVITCGLCNELKTTMLGTERCDRCHELEMRVISNIDLTLEILLKHGVLTPTSEELKNV